MSFAANAREYVTITPDLPLSLEEGETALLVFAACDTRTGVFTIFYQPEVGEVIRVAFRSTGSYGGNTATDIAPEVTRFNPMPLVGPAVIGIPPGRAMISAIIVPTDEIPIRPELPIAPEPSFTPAGKSSSSNR